MVGNTPLLKIEYLIDSNVRIHPLEPANSPTLRTGTCVGSHRIQDISDEFAPSIVKLDQLYSIVDVWEGDAKLCRSLGLAVGISSRANILGAIKLHSQIGPDSTVITLLPFPIRSTCSPIYAAANRSEATTNPPKSTLVTTAPFVRNDLWVESLLSTVNRTLSIDSPSFCSDTWQAYHCRGIESNRFLPCRRIERIATEFLPYDRDRSSAPIRF